MNVELIEHWGTDLTVVNAARVSFDKESTWVASKDGPSVSLALSEQDEKLISYLARNRHMSCFEHMGATLRLRVPIFVARQIQRHRSFSYNEVSRRYVDTGPEFYFPSRWRKRADNLKQGSSSEVVTIMKSPSLGKDVSVEETTKALVDYASLVYENMLEAGVAPELARMILPQNMYTEFFMTGNLRAWAHFLELRLESTAQEEARDVAGMVADILRPLFPSSMEALLKESPW